MTQYCAKITPLETTLISPVGGSGAAWPGSLVSSPLTYTHNGLTYVLDSESLYKFHVPIQNTTNMIIYDGDVERLLDNLTGMIVPGQVDEGKATATLFSKLLTSRIKVLCTTAANVTKWQLDQLGIENRIVRVLRSGTPNNFYDGHVINEVKINGQWAVIDMSLGFKFKDSQSNLLSLKDAIFPTSDKFIDMHFMKDRMPSETHSNNVYHHSSTVDIFLSDRNDTVQWQSDLMHIPGIDHSDGKTYFYMPSGTGSRQSWVEGLSSNFVVVSEATWNTMFY